jgi:RNA polymerase sigma factor (sigma-70 family)
LSKFNPDFWEVHLSDTAWNRMAEEDHPFYEDVEDRDLRHERSDQASDLLPDLREVMGQVLTDRQLEVVDLYYFGSLNQREIAQHLGISQQSVSERLYGKARNGRVVGGALQKLRRELLVRGISW